MVNYAVLIISISLAIAGQMLMKQGMNVFGSFSVTRLPQMVIPVFLNPWVFCGLVAFAASSIFWLVVLSRLNLSQAYPMVSVAYVIVPLLSLYFFKESIPFLRWIGIAVICLGVILISRS